MPGWEADRSTPTLVCGWLRVVQVRPFVLKEVDMSVLAHNHDLDPSDPQIEEKMSEVLAKQVRAAAPCLYPSTLPTTPLMAIIRLLGLRRLWYHGCCSAPPGGVLQVEEMIEEARADNPEPFPFQGQQILMQNFHQVGHARPCLLPAPPLCGEVA